MSEPVRFGRSDPFSLGAEEELFLVDRDGGLLNLDPPLHEELAGGRIASEVHACQVELITPICTTASEAVESLGRLRAAVRRRGPGLIGSGTHPTALEGEARITDEERYRFIRGRLGDAIATPVSALHVHVGMPDAETAVRVFNGLRGRLPLLEALAANSPFRHGRDTGLACSRELNLRTWPRSGVLRELRDYADWEETTRRLSAVAEVPDYTFHWWRLRPHPRLGTVEIRTLDAQAPLERVGALVALIQALAAHLAETPPLPGPAPEILDEASFRAARYGVQASLPDGEGRLRPVAELLAEALEMVADRAAELGGTRSLEALEDLLADGGGAGEQRAAHRGGGLGTVLDQLMAITAAGPQSAGSL